MHNAKHLPTSLFSSSPEITRTLALGMRVVKIYARFFQTRFVPVAQVHLGLDVARVVGLPDPAWRGSTVFGRN